MDDSNLAMIGVLILCLFLAAFMALGMITALSMTEITLEKLFGACYLIIAVVGMAGSAIAMGYGLGRLVLLLNK